RPQLLASEFELNYVRDVDDRADDVYDYHLEEVLQQREPERSQLLPLLDLRRFCRVRVPAAAVQEILTDSRPRLRRPVVLDPLPEYHHGGFERVEALGVPPRPGLDHQLHQIVPGGIDLLVVPRIDTLHQATLGEHRPAPAVEVHDDPSMMQLHDSSPPSAAGP